MHIASQTKRKMTSNGTGRMNCIVPLRRLFFGACVLLAVSLNVSAQPPQIPEPPLPLDPTPLTQLITAAEKAMLAEANNPKKLVEAYLKISDAHLQSALAVIKGGNNGADERELDSDNKDLAETGKQAFGVQEGKRGLSKRIEQTLYKQIKTLETIDRLFPPEREAFSDAALKHAKQLRVQALNEAFASGDVLRDPEGDKKPENEQPPKEPSHRVPQGRFGVTRDIRVGGFAPATAAVGIMPSREASQIPGDYLTEEEDDHVREAQVADARVKVFMKIADRRIKALSEPTAPPVTDKKDQKKLEEEEREWGALPKLTRTELLRHYSRAISECMAKLEDAYE